MDSVDRGPTKSTSEIAKSRSRPAARPSDLASRPPTTPAPIANKSYEPPSPQLFSFNNPQGMCPDCDGLGERYTFDPDLLIPDPSLSLCNGAIPLVGPLKSMGRWRRHIYEGVAKTLGIDLKTPWQDLPQEQRDLAAARQRRPAHHLRMEAARRRRVEARRQMGRHRPATAQQFQEDGGRARARRSWRSTCASVAAPDCQGQRLNPQARAVRVGGKTLLEVLRHADRRSRPRGSIRKRASWKRASRRSSAQIAAEVLKEIRGRLGFLLNVGLHYLSLDRSAPTLSGGEAQRIRLAGQIGCGLVGVLYILDEPSIGLHPRDNDRLLRSLERLRDMGNTVVVVEHDEETMRAADHIVDFGPGPGVRGGEVVAAGSYGDIVASPDSLTGQYLAGTQQIDVPDAAPAAQRQDDQNPRGPAAQPQEHRRRDSARPVRLRHRRQRLGQELAGQRHPVEGLELAIEASRLKREPTDNGNGDEETTSRKPSIVRSLRSHHWAPRTSTRSSTSTSRRSAARRARIRRRTSKCSTKSARCSRSCPRRRFAATSRAASASTSRAAAARRARATAPIASRWISSPTCG